MLFSSFVDVDEWNKAQWKGVFFAVSPNTDEPPAVGFLFLNEASGRKIFEDLVKSLGREDINELIRFSIIEGDIPDEAAGYSVYFGTDWENRVKLLKANGEEQPDPYVMTVGRFHRMNPAPNSPFLAGFKKEYEKKGVYLLMPAFGTQTSLRPEFDLSIQKKQIQFLKTDELGKNDVESVVLKKPQ